MHRLEDRTLVANVSRRCQPKPPDQAGAHVRQDVAVQVRHHQHLVVVRRRVRHDLQACVVEQLGVKVHFGKVLADVTRRLEEEAVRHLHDGRLVYRPHLLPAHVFGILEGKAEDPFRRLFGDELDALHHPVHNHMLDAGIFALGVLPDQDGVDVVIWRLVPRYRFARPDVGEEVECPSQGEVERNMAFANRSLSSVQSKPWSYTAFLTAKGPFRAT